MDTLRSRRSRSAGKGSSATGAWHIRSQGSESLKGQSVGDQRYRDTIVSAQLSLLSGGPDDLYGLFLRQLSETAYYFFAFSPQGHCVIAEVDGVGRPLVAAELAADIPFNRGFGAINTIGLVAGGLSVVLLVNRAVVTATFVNVNYKEGYLGYYLQHGGGGEDSELAVDWIQVRAVLPEDETA